MKTIFRSDWSIQIGDKWQTRNAEKKQVIHLMAEEKIERWSKIVARLWPDVERCQNFF